MSENTDHETIDHETIDCETIDLTNNIRKWKVFNNLIKFIVTWDGVFIVLHLANMTRDYLAITGKKFNY